MSNGAVCLVCCRGDACPYSHGVYECWLHPAKYRTQLCKEGPHCRRPVCFFAHSVLDLRQPTHVWDGNSYEVSHAVLACELAVAWHSLQGLCCVADRLDTRAHASWPGFFLPRLTVFV